MKSRSCGAGSTRARQGSARAAPGGAGAAAGEVASRHWAYLPPVSPALPRVRSRSWPKTPIDWFILARLEQAGLAPTAPASRQALLRRVTLDLIGLPPTPAEIDAFLADRRPGAYERVVDRLLASPHFGERWALPWLDAARYADSHGYQVDGRRSIWKYREWVVEALNADLPFDRFTIEQLAGDLLPDPTEAQKVATGFHRNTLFNQEAGVDPEEARWERLVDRVGTTATVWLGTTLACAQCHDHKHDPFTSKDFYGLLAFFDGASEYRLFLPTPAQTAERTRIDAEAAQLDKILAAGSPALEEEQRAWEAELRGLAGRFGTLRPKRLTSARGARLEVIADGSVLVTSAPVPGARPEVERMESETDLDQVTGLRLEALPDTRLPEGGPGRGVDGNLFLSAVELEVAPRTGRGGWQAVTWKAAFSDDRPRDEPERYAVANLVAASPRRANLDPETPRGWGVSAVYDGKRRLPRQAVLVPDRPFGFPGGTRLRVSLRYDQGWAGDVIGRFRLSVTDQPAPEAITAISATLRPLLDLPQASRPPADRDRLAEAYRAVAPALAATRARRAALAEQRAAQGIVMTLALRREPGPPRETLMREGGSFTRLGPRVWPALPAVLAGVASASGQLDRLALARWLVSAENPLTARVTVNRLWEKYFGRGLVETVEDFGTRGARPSHPELLDWLAIRFVRERWSLKAIHRLIVTSAVYRQSSLVPPAQRDRRRDRDPENRLLGHFPRLRLDGELVRDLALSASGLLDSRRGGPPVFPPQPPGVFSAPNSVEPPWPTTDGGDRYRRSLYTFWRRTAPYPTVALFDAPSREVCTVRRARTNTPLQALAALNDPGLWEAAEAMARRMLQASARAADGIAEGFRRCTGRWPSREEREVLEALYTRQRAQGTPELAALALVANVMLNLDETLTRN
jgi:hypothetical protein